jgi:hypothetical protein
MTYSVPESLLQQKPERSRVEPTIVLSLQSSKCVHKRTALGQPGNVDVGTNKEPIRSNYLLCIGRGHVLNTVHVAIPPSGTLPCRGNGKSEGGNNLGCWQAVSFTA